MNKRRRPPLNFWQKAQAFPPLLCRLLAKHTGHHGRALGAPLTNAELAQATGLSEFQVVTLSQQLDWTGIDLPTMQKFVVACGLDFEDKRQCKRALQYLRGSTRKGLHLAPRWTFLRRHPDWEAFFKPLCTKLQLSLQTKINKKSK